jgi:hypothetical protein
MADHKAHPKTSKKSSPSTKSKFYGTPSPVQANPTDNVGQGIVEQPTVVGALTVRMEGRNIIGYRRHVRSQ